MDKLTQIKIEKLTQQLKLLDIKERKLSDNLQSVDIRKHLDKLTAGSVALKNKQYRDAGRCFLGASLSLYQSTSSESPSVARARLKQANMLREQGEAMLEIG